jgi:hypothetical protein
MKGDCCVKSCFSGCKDKLNKCCDKIEQCKEKFCDKFGSFLHKCKAKLSGCCDICDKCDKGNKCDKGGDCCGKCCGGCNTAATPQGCGNTVIPPATAPVVPAKPADPKKIPEKVGSAYPMVKPGPITVEAAHRVIEVTPAPF